MFLQFYVHSKIQDYLIKPSYKKNLLFHTFYNGEQAVQIIYTYLLIRLYYMHYMIVSKISNQVQINWRC